MANINVKIALDGGSFTAQAGKVKAETRQMQATVSGSFESITAKVTAFSFAFEQISAVAGRVAGALQAPIDSFRQFETAIANVESLGVANIGALRASVLDTAQDIAAPIADLSAGLYDVVSAGVDAANQVDFLRLTAKASKAGLAETTDAIRIGSAFIKGYGKDWNETEGILDQAFQTVKLGQTTFAELAASMGQNIPVAAALNISTQALFGSYATLTGVTGTTAEVSTQMKAVLTGLAAPTDNLTKLIREQGFASVEAAVKQKGLVGIVNIVRDATQGSASAMAKYFSSVEATTALLALTGAQYDTLVEKTGAMTNSAGAMSDAYDIANQTLDSQIQLLQNKFETRMIEAANSLKPFLEQMVSLSVVLLDVDWTPFAVGAATAGVALAGMKVGVWVNTIGGIPGALSVAATAFRTFSVSVTTSLAAIPVAGWVAAGVSALAGLSTALLVASKDEQELAQERRTNAKETVKLIEEEKKRVKQALKTSKANEDLKDRLEELNVALMDQQKIIADANLSEYSAKLEDARDAFGSMLGAFDEGHFKRFFGVLGENFFKQGELTRKLVDETEGDFEKILKQATQAQSEIIGKLNDHRLKITQLSERQIEKLEAEKSAYGEIINKTADVLRFKRLVNDEQVRLNDLLDGTIKKEEDAAKVVVDKANEIVNSFRNVEIKPLVDFEFRTPDLEAGFDINPPEMSAAEEINFEEQLRRNSIERKLGDEATWYENRIGLLDDYLAQLALKDEENTLRYAEVLAERNLLDEEAANRRVEIQLATASAVFQSIQNLTGIAGKESATLFAINKAAAVSESIVNTYSAANKALTANKPPLSFALAAATITAGLANVAKISATKLQSKRTGGFIGNGPNVVAAGAFGGGENRLIRANDGEFVVNSHASRVHAGLLNIINNEPNRVRPVERSRVGSSGLPRQSGAPQDFDYERLGSVISDSLRENPIVFENLLDGQELLRREIPRYERAEEENTF